MALRLISKAEDANSMREGVYAHGSRLLRGQARTSVVGLEGGTGLLFQVESVTIDVKARSGWLWEK